MAAGGCAGGRWRLHLHGPAVSRLLPDGEGACGAPHRHGPHARWHRSAQVPAAGVGDGRSRHPGAVCIRCRVPIARHRQLGVERADEP
eukprot:scaffold1270_cov56-Phaeocystis_antarctica.AAC.2